MDQDRTPIHPSPEHTPAITSQTTAAGDTSGPQRNSPTSHYETVGPSAASPSAYNVNPGYPSSTLPHNPLPPLPPPTPITIHSYGEGIPTGVDVPGVARIPTVRSPRRRPTGDLDWVIPIENDKRETQLHRPKSVGERLLPTIEHAEAERARYALKAKMTGYALNIAIGLQVLLGALTTGLSAVTSGRQTSIMTSILGGLSTIVASYLARARGSNEPELSITRTKDLEKFVRECQSFVMDVGHTTGNEHDEQLRHFRRTFEELLGNANGERRLSPV